MADFGDFIAGFTGQLLADRTKDADAKRENEEWERRQRLLNDLDVDVTKRKHGLERKDGRVFQDAEGKWMVEVLDGGGNVTGTRAASAAERAKEEATVLDTDMKRDEFEYRPKERSLDERYKNALIGESAERSRSMRENRAADANANTVNPEGLIETWLNSAEGKLAVKAYTGTMGRVADTGKVKGGSMEGYLDSSEEEQGYTAYQQLKQDIISAVKAMPPEQRPKTESEFRALITRLANQSRSSLDRYSR